MNKFLLVIASLLLLSLSCALMVAGGSSEHDCRIVGYVKGIDNKPVANTWVWLAPSNYVQGFSEASFFKTTATDSLGKFTFDSLDTGSYTVYGKRYDTPFAFVQRSIVLNECDTFEENHTLNHCGTVYIDRTKFHLDSNSYIVVLGLPIAIRCSESQIRLDHLPSGNLCIRGYNPVTDSTILLGDLEHLFLKPGSVTIYSDSSPSVTFSTAKKPDTLKNFYGVPNTFYSFQIFYQAINTDSSYKYLFSWGDDSLSGWLSEPVATHAWKQPGSYPIYTQIKHGDSFLGWSPPIYIIIKESSQ